MRTAPAQTYRSVQEVSRGRGEIEQLLQCLLRNLKAFVQYSSGTALLIMAPAAGWNGRKATVAPFLTVPIAESYVSTGSERVESLESFVP